MAYFSTSRVAGKVSCLLLMAGLVNCKGHDPKGQSTDTMTVSPAEKDAATSGKGEEAVSAEKDTGPMALSTLPDGTQIWKRPRTKVNTSRLFIKDDRMVELDGEALFYIPHATGKPFVIHTRNLVITVQAAGTCMHVDAFASSPGEEVDLLMGKLRVTKSYHSSTDNEPEVLAAGDMVMINRDIDLMEKEKLDPAERKAVETKFPMSAVIAPHN